MIFFIDESGHPHPNDPNPYPVLTAVGIPLEASRQLMAILFGLKRDILGLTELPHDDTHYKAHHILNERTHRRQPAKWRFAEALVEAAAALPVVSFHVIMERPALAPQLDCQYVPYHVRFLLERVNQYMVNHCGGRIAPVVFDSRSAGADATWCQGIGNFLYRHKQGQAWTSVYETPLFVSSALTPGVQVADYFVSVVRQYWDIRRGNREVGAVYGKALFGLYRRVKSTVVDLELPAVIGEDRGKLWGEYLMPGRFWEL